MGYCSFSGAMSLGEIYAPDEYTRGGNISHTGEHCPVPEGMRFSYGTAGFRADASYLPFVVFRVGCIAGIRSRLFHFMYFLRLS